MKKTSEEKSGDRIPVLIGASLPGDVSAEQKSALGIVEWQLSTEVIERIERLESERRLAQLQSGQILIA